MLGVDRTTAASRAASAPARCGAAAPQAANGPARRRGDRRRDRGRALVRAADRARRVPRLHVPARGTDPGIRPRWFDFARSSRGSSSLDAEGRRATRCSSRSGGCRAASPTSSPSSSPSSSAAVARSAGAARSVRLKLRLLSEPGVVVTDVPAVTRPTRGGPTPERLAVRVLVADVHAGSLRALNYAESLGVEDTRAVSSPSTRRTRRDSATSSSLHGPGAARPERRAVSRHRHPLLAYIRELTADPAPWSTSSCPSSSSAAGRASSTTSARSTSSGCCSSSRT